MAVQQQDGWSRAAVAHAQDGLAHVDPLQREALEHVHPSPSSTVHAIMNSTLMVQDKRNRRRTAGPEPADPRVELLGLLAEPLRLRVVDRLGQAGPATVSQLAGELQVPLPQLSNHLRRLREHGLVTAERRGRQAVYRLADPGLELLLPLLDRITGRLPSPPGPGRARPARSRTCYRHLAGPLGVALYRALVARRALEERPDGTLALGATAAPALASLGVDPGALTPGRRPLAFQCLDATERAPHLAGALGDAVAAALLGGGWVERTPGGREVRLTTRGAAALDRELGLALAPGPVGA
jgi:DNA-binding transcriptional ArsR family regulator